MQNLNNIWEQRKKSFYRNKNKHKNNGKSATSMYCKPASSYINFITAFTDNQALKQVNLHVMSIIFYIFSFVSCCFPSTESFTDNLWWQLLLLAVVQQQQKKDVRAGVSNATLCFIYIPSFTD